MNVPRTRKIRPPAPAGSVELAVDSTRSRILAAALSSFAERGFHGTSVPDIAQAAQVGVGSIYRHFESKERLVNAVFRDTKTRLRDGLLLNFDLGRPARALFTDIWDRLVRFQRLEPTAFQFLEMQDHVPYLDAESRALEATLLLPILAATETANGVRAGNHTGDNTPALLIAMVWGSFVSLTKAERLGYLTLDASALRRAGEIAFAAITFALDLHDRTTDR